MIALVLLYVSLLLLPQQIPTSDREIVEQTLETVLRTLRETLNVSFIPEELRTTVEQPPSSLEHLARQIRRARREAWLAYQQAVDAGNDSLAYQLKEVYQTLRQLEQRVEHLAPPSHMPPPSSPWLPSGHYGRKGYKPPRTLRNIEDIEGSIMLPLYHMLPATRYNRVEGLTLGVGIPPFQGYRSLYEHARLYGEIGYAFALKSWRYEVGLEMRPRARRHKLSGQLPILGVAYYRNTFTEDAWKMHPVENSLAAFFTRNDYFDYYEAEGWRVYLRQPLGHGVELIGGYRSETHTPLRKHTSWSLFDQGTFRPNPPATPGRVHMFFTQAKAQHLYGTSAHPQGWSWLVDMEFARGLGGDFSYNRVQTELRLYFPLIEFYHLYLRSRYGMANGDLPLQKQFTIGGVGTLRAYPQNAYRGTRMWIASAELAIPELSMLGNDHQFFFLADAGWIGDKTSSFQLSDVKVNAGFGFSLDERKMRFEIAWPVGDPERKKAVIWFRLLPSF